MTNRTRPPFCPENSSLKHFPLKSSFVKPSLFIRALACIGALVLSLISLTATAQDMQYRARLSPMPTTPQTKSTITGAGEALATLSGTTLTLRGDFSGMSSAATMAHVHFGPPAQPGPVVATLEIAAQTSGALSASIELSVEQLRALTANSLYVQIHSESNPAGELRGWLFPKK